MALGESFQNRSITNFRDRLVGGGARPNMFEVNITLPEQIAPNGDISQDMRFLVKGAEIPAAIIGLSLIHI